MRYTELTIAFAMAVAATGGSACAMSNASNAAPRCTVSGPDMIVSSLGGAEALCATVNRITAPAAGQASVHIAVLNAHAAVAQATIAGRKLPERRLDVSDHSLTPRSIESLASAVADQLRALKD
jgi:hypothetical protein